MAALDDRNIDLKAGNERLERTDVMGVTPNYTDVRNIGVAQGRMITEADDEHRAQIVFIGADVATKLFPNVDPIGKTLRAETHEYQVVGVATPIGSAFGQSQDNFVIMPIHTYQREFHKQNDWVGIFIQAPSAELMDPSKDEARMLMRARRHLDYNAPDNFAILGSDSIMALWHDLTGTLATAAVGMVSVFLVVGGIVIMNIMLASVTERTREIGVRRSLGARKIHILMQFVTESGVLAAVGGVIGHCGSVWNGAVWARDDFHSAAGTHGRGDYFAVAFHRRSDCFLGFIRPCGRRSWIPSKRCERTDRSIWRRPMAKI